MAEWVVWQGKRARLFHDMMEAVRLYRTISGARLCRLCPDGWITIAWGGSDSKVGPSRQERDKERRMNREALVEGGN